MRRFWAFYLVINICCLISEWGGSRAFGNDRARVSVFRALTSEHSEGPAMTAAVEQGAIAPAPATEQPSMPAQPIAAPRMSSSSPVYLQAPVAQPHRPVNLYGGNSARQTINQFPRNASIQTNGPRPTRRQFKPFTNVQQEPTLSPYLNLDRDENDTQNVPNYYTYVRPQMEQIQTNRKQQREIQQLRGQLQGVTSSGGLPQYEANRSAGMGSPARYMDTAQFYRGMR